MAPPILLLNHWTVPGSPAHSRLVDAVESFRVLVDEVARTGPQGPHPVDGWLWRSRVVGEVAKAERAPGYVRRATRAEVERALGGRSVGEVYRGTRS